MSQSKALEDMGDGMITAGRAASTSETHPASDMKQSDRVANPLNLVSPPGSKTPPSMPAKKTLFFPEPVGSHSKVRTGAEPVDPAALSRALKEYEEAARRRERTPGTSPSRKRQRVYGDRYAIPALVHGRWNTLSRLLPLVGNSP